MKPIAVVPVFYFSDPVKITECLFMNRSGTLPSGSMSLMSALMFAHLNHDCPALLIAKIKMFAWLFVFKSCLLVYEYAIFFKRIQ